MSCIVSNDTVQVVTMCVLIQSIFKKRNFQKTVRSFVLISYLLNDL